MINKFLRFLFALPIIVFLAGLITVNIRINYPPQVEVIGNDTVNVDLLKELRGLKHALNNGADVDMQKMYP